MPAIQQNFDMYAGETIQLPATITYASSGALVDFSAATITFRIKRGSTTLLSKTVGSGITVTGSGTFTVTIDTGDTTSMSGNYSYEIRATLASGTVSTMIVGTIYVATTEVP